jgi:hypothetical protein
MPLNEAHSLILWHKLRLSFHASLFSFKLTCLATLGPPAPICPRLGILAFPHSTFAEPPSISLLRLAPFLMTDDRRPTTDD